MLLSRALAIEEQIGILPMKGLVSFRSVLFLSTFVILLCACQTPSVSGGATAGSGSSASVPVASSVTPEAARNMANNCFTCHGPKGKSPGSIPSLNRLSAAGIADKLRNFRSGALPSTVMGRHVKAYSDNEIDAVAAYIAALNK